MPLRSTALADEATMRTSITIDERYCGPPGTGNGGYVCGRLATLIDAPVAEVTLRRPVPIGSPLSTEGTDDRAISLKDGDGPIATAKPFADLSLDPPVVPSYREAVRAMLGCVGLSFHGLPRCFVCGPERTPGDGLRIFPGPLDGREGTVAAPWTPDASLADHTGTIRPEFVWAAMDCPGAFALMNGQFKAMLLGRMTAGVRRPLRAREQCVVLGWRIGQEGKKQIAGSALFGEPGDLVATAKAVWFDVNPASAPEGI
jgi:hypothetical protein